MITFLKSVPQPCLYQSNNPNRLSNRAPNNRLAKTLIVFLVATLFTLQTGFATVIHVDRNVQASGNGSTWSLAKKTIGEGLASAAAGDELWVANGPYTENLTLKQGVDLYGGFRAVETLREERDPYLNPVPLASTSGSLYAVVITVADIRFDGFAVSGGSTASIRVANVGSDVIISNCEIRCSPMDAIRCDHAQPTIEGCLIHSNGDDGIYCYYSAPAITSCVIVGNKNNGINCDHGSPVVDACRVIGNKNSGVYCANSSYPLLSNALVVGNAASGASLTTSSILTAVNCGFISNMPSGTAYGGAIVLSGASLMTLRNSFFVDNTRKALRENTAGLNDLANCLFYGNPDGDYFDYEKWNTFTGAAAINANVVGAVSNLSGDPLFNTAGSGTWTGPPSYNSATGRTTLVDANASYEPGSLVGMIINCDVLQRRHALIAANSATSIDVITFDSTVYIQTGDAYQIKDFHTAEDSPCTDAGGATGVPDIDLDGYPRPMDVPMRGADSTGTEYDIGPYEFQPDFGDKQLRIMGVEGGGAISTSSGMYAYATPAVLQATPNRGCAFDHWLIRENVQPPTVPLENTVATSPYNLVMVHDWDVWAYFTGTPLYILTTAADGPGSVAPTQGTYEENTSVEVTAAANAGARFVRWEGSASGTQNPISVVMNADKSVSAVFIPVYALTTFVVGSGSVTPAFGSYDSCTEVTLNAWPDPGWAFRRWEGAATGTANPSAVVMDTQKSVTAVFVLSLPDIALSDITLGSSTALRSGESFTLTWTVSNTGYQTAAPPWCDKVYISRDQSLDAADRILATVNYTEELPVGQTHSASVSPTMPDLAPGRYFLLVEGDASDSVAEVEDLSAQTAIQAVTVKDSVLSGSR